MTCLPSSPKPLRHRAQFRFRAAAALNCCQKPCGRASFLPISAAVGSEIRAPKARHGQEQLLERKMESRRATSEQRSERTALDARFGKIGISAVAAALRSRSESKTPAYAPAADPDASQYEEATA